MMVKVTRRADARDALPARLSQRSAVSPQSAINTSRPRVFGITMVMMTWGINGRRFEMDGVTAFPRPSGASRRRSGVSQ